MTKRRLPMAEHADTLSLKALRELVTGLVERADRAEIRIEKLEADNRKLREENDLLRVENTRLKVDNQLLRDEIARLKNLPPRPPFRPSGMDQATSDKTVAGSRKPARRRGPKGDKGSVTREEVLPANAPPGSRFKGYKDCVVRDLVVRAEVVRYRRECWVAPDGRTIVAPLPAGIKGGYGASLRRFCLMLHSHGQVTTQRLTTLLNDVGIEISKRQVIRFLTERLDGFHAEDAAVLHAGLVSAPFVTVDDTGARHANRNFHTTQIGGEHFTAFRTAPSKSRLNFLALLRGNYQDYVLNDAAFTFLEDRQVDPALLARLNTRQPRRFANQVPFLEYLAANGIDIFDKEIIRPFAEAGIWGAIRHHGLVGNAVIVSDDAGQFRVGTHALCWVHAERLLHKLMPATPGQVRHVETLRDLIWRFYKALKAYQRRPDPRAARSLQARFDRIFSLRTGYGDLDKLVFRLRRRKAELLRVLERPETPLHTNASERDLRGFVIKRKISGGTVSRNGRQARDSMLGLMKTCQKLGLSFWHYLGDRLGISDEDHAVAPLASLVAARA
ncbi:transposase [Rhizobium leguminosarum bv. viciae]|uniref:IS66 family transposase n=1 Tax=Rhizobium leguminosarum TaxID=384 RepID=UPI00103D0047|nr:transposase [Rhizobium leguminosarum]TBY35976.1 transposase [Rhizobium leguminosarum bv. viciae]TCB08566.1 transposase [Rhizobium leguminosarum bv. viciae]